jgi:hypothetical protein
MAISMARSANYVTQQSMWGVQFGKNLTNRTITKYQKLGYYSNGIVRAEYKNEKRQTRKRVILETLFQGF